MVKMENNLMVYNIRVYVKQSQEIITRQISAKSKCKAIAKMIKSLDSWYEVENLDMDNFSIEISTIAHITY
jgi:hypothetical protein